MVKIGSVWQRSFDCINYEVAGIDGKQIRLVQFPKGWPQFWLGGRVLGSEIVVSEPELLCKFVEFASRDAAMDNALTKREFAERKEIWRSETN